MKKLQINIDITEYKGVEEFDTNSQRVIEAAKESAKSAYAPYSEFKVGAAVLLKNNEIIKGNNQENVAYPSGLCAERVAMFYANAIYPDVPALTIAVCAMKNGVYTDDFVPPCGSCRQVILETENRFNSPIKVILYGKNRIVSVESSRLLLPLDFNKCF